MNPLSYTEKITIIFKIYIIKVKEFTRHDSKLLSLLLSLIYLTQIIFFRLLKKTAKSIIITGKMYRHTKFGWVRYISTQVLKRTINNQGQKEFSSKLNQYNYINNTKLVAELRKSIINNSADIFHNRLLILSPPGLHCRGVICIKFTNFFRYFIELFDEELIAKKYILLVEPSSSGYFDEDILSLLSLKTPVIIQASEPKDFRFIENLSTNFYPIDIGANCWVDHRIFFPIRQIAKVFDIVMVSNWADVKRHYHLFESMSKAKLPKNFKVALIGTPWPNSSNSILKIATYFGVQNMIEIFENISQKEVNILLNMSKVFLLLSKKEGFNKAIIEAMYSDTPVFLLEGFNYGYKYNYINEMTGNFINHADLPHFIEKIDYYLEMKSYSPNKWISTNISPELSTKKLKQLIKRIEKETKLHINSDLAVKVNTPDLQYFDSTHLDKFQQAYKDLASFLKQR